MKVVFIGNYRSGSGWSIAAKNYIRALMTISSVELAIRPIYLCNSTITPLEWDLIELERKKFSSADIVIQKVLPYMSTYDGRFQQNILLSVLETRNLEMMGWRHTLNAMDKILTPDIQGKAEFENICNRPVFSVGEALDVDSIQNNSNTFPLNIHSSYLKFYTIAEYSDRKNIHVIIDAYLAEFTKLDNVSLILRINGGPQVIQKLQEYIEVSKKLRLRRFLNGEMYPSISIIPNKIEDIISLHKICDCYINASRGEAFSLPSAESLICGNPVICTAGIGTTDYVNNKNGWIIPSVEDTILSKTPAITDYNTSNETWKNISILDLRRAMREAYENKQMYKEKSKAAAETANLFKYEVVGKRIQQALEVYK